MNTILFVCTGNTCRSSMAEVLFRELIEKEGEKIKGVKVLSAGIAAIPGNKASDKAIRVMEEMGLDLKNHRTRPLTPSLIKEADLILTMTQAHKRSVIAMDPGAADKTYTLKEFISGPDNVGRLRFSSMDIVDPFGQPIEVYRECARELKQVLKQVVRKLEDGI